MDIRSRVKFLIVVPAMTAVAFTAPALVPSDAPVPQVLKVSEAHAAPLHCINVAKHTLAVTRGNLGAARNALRNTRGCGDTLSDGICWASRQWWGHGARATVWAVTGGRYTRC
jgi:hypothetical protein